MVQQKLCEAEAEVEAKNWEKWNSEFASREINQILESQRVGGLIRLKEIKLACMKNWNWEIGSSRKTMQENAKKLKNCFCNNRDILRLWVRWLQKNSGFSEQSEFLEWCKRILRSWIKEQLSSDPRSLIQLLLFWVPEPCRVAILDGCVIHWLVRVLKETFLNDHLLNKDDPPQSTAIQRIWHLVLRN